MLEYINIFIIHEFLLRVYLTMSQQIEKYKKALIIYTIVIAAVYTVTSLIESSLYCANGDETGSTEHTYEQKAFNVTLAGIVLIINPIIVFIVLRELKSRISGPGTIRTMFIKIALLGCLFELAFSLRIVLILNQYNWKQKDPWKYNLVFTVYILIGEIACQVVLITGIIVYTHKLRVKYLRPKSPATMKSSNTYNSSTQSSQNQNESCVQLLPEKPDATEKQAVQA